MVAPCTAATIGLSILTSAFISEPARTLAWPGRVPQEIRQIVAGEERIARAVPEHDMSLIILAAASGYLGEVTYMLRVIAFFFAGDSTGPAGCFRIVR